MRFASSKGILSRDAVGWTNERKLRTPRDVTTRQQFSTETLTNLTLAFVEHTAGNSETLSVLCSEIYTANSLSSGARERPLQRSFRSILRFVAPEFAI